MPDSHERSVFRSAGGPVFSAAVIAALIGGAPHPVLAHPAPVTATVAQAPSPDPSATTAPDAMTASPAPATTAAPSDTNASTNPTDQTRVDKRNPLSPASQPATGPQFGGILGDFGNGTRSRLAQEGLTVNAHIVDEAAANITGGIPQPGGTAQDRGTAIASEFGFGVDADFGKMTHSGAGILHLLVTTRFGNNLAAQALGNLVSVQEIYGDGQTTRFTYLDYEQPLFNNHVNIEFGKYNQQNDFIAGSSYWGGNLYCFFQNNNVCGTPAMIPINNGVVPTGTEGYNYYPSSMWGGRLRVNPTKDFYLQIAALQANPIVNSPIGGNYFGFYGDTGTEIPAEIGYTMRKSDGSVAGNIRFGGYFDTSNVYNYATRATGLLTVYPGQAGSAAAAASNAAAVASIGTTYSRGRSGGDIQFDHLLAGSSKPGESGLTLFAAGEYSDPNTSLIGTFYDAGLVKHGFGTRKNDTISVAFSSENFNGRLQNLENSLRAQGYAVPYSSSEKAVELNYGCQVNSWWLLRPGAQLVINPNGGQTNPYAGYVATKNALVFGLTSVISF